MSVEFSEGLTKRLHILQDYQEKLIEEFGEDDYNVFIFGSFPTEEYIEAGVGKTFVMKQIIKDLRAQGKKVVVSAFTMLAALNLDDSGNTILGAFHTYPSGLNFDSLGMRRLTRSDAWHADVIIIDEISMCPKGLFEYICRAIKKISWENNKRPIQLIVCGDFLQLPPICGKGKVPEYAFESNWWKKSSFRSVMLETSHRQRDEEYFACLCEIRKGLNIEKNLGYLKQNAHYLEKLEDAVTLCPYRADVKKINNEKIDKLDGEAEYYYAKANSEVVIDKMGIWDCLKLKVGTLVMTIFNDPNGRYYNGLTGHIVGMTTDTVTIEFIDSTKEHPHIEEIGFHKWEYDGNNGEIYYVEQLPVIPAYAVTIHKAQGCTLDYVNVDPRCFADGQLYVALSRVKSVKHLYINKKISEKDIMVNKKVLKFYEELQNSIKTQNLVVGNIERGA